MTICLEVRDDAARRLQNRVISVIKFISKVMASKSNKNHDILVLGTTPIKAWTSEEATVTVEYNCKTYFNNLIKHCDRKTISAKFRSALHPKQTDIPAIDELKDNRIVILMKVSHRPSCILTMTTRTTGLRSGTEDKQVIKSKKEKGTMRTALSSVYVISVTSQAFLV
jgi:hypothetical protein